MHLKLFAFLLVVVLQLVHLMNANKYSLGAVKIQATEKTKFTVPQSFCTPSFSMGVLAVINQQRQSENLPPLVFFDKATISAQTFATERQEDKSWHKENLKEFAQLSWAMKNNTRLAEVDLGFWTMFENKGTGSIIWDTTKTLPLYTGLGESKFLSDDKWSRVTKLGIGCSTWHSSSETWTYINLFFSHPDLEKTTSQMEILPLFRFNSHKHDCPKQLAFQLVKIINLQRMSENYEKLVYSQEVSEKAKELANGLASKKQKVNLKGFSQLTWYRKFESPRETTLTISENDPFFEKWSMVVRPEYTKDYTEKPLSSSDWADSKFVGVGCTITNNPNDKIVRLQIVILFKLNE